MKIDCEERSYYVYQLEDGTFFRGIEQTLDGPFTMQTCSDLSSASGFCSVTEMEERGIQRRWFNLSGKFVKVTKKITYEVEDV